MKKTNNIRELSLKDVTLISRSASRFSCVQFATWIVEQGYFHSIDKLWYKKDSKDKGLDAKQLYDLCFLPPKKIKK